MSEGESDDEYYDHSHSENTLCDSLQIPPHPTVLISIRPETTHDTLEEVLSKQASCALCRRHWACNPHIRMCRLRPSAAPSSGSGAIQSQRNVPEDEKRVHIHQKSDSRWIARAADLRDRDGGDVAYALKRRALDGRPAGMRMRIIVELGVLEALEGEVHLLAADAAAVEARPGIP